MDSGLVELVDAWVDDRRARSRHGLSPASERAYRSDLAGLARRIADAHGRADPDPPDGDDAAGPNAATNRQLARVTVADLTEDNLAAVASALVADGYAASTRARMLSAWRGLCRWLVRHGHLTSDPTLGFETPAAPSQLPVAFSDAELARILDAAATPDPDSTAAWPARDVALVAVLAGAGLRASELTAMKVGDVGRDDAYRLRVTGKGGKQRVVPVAVEVVHTIDAYLSDRRARQLGGQASDHILFVRTDGRRFNTQALDHLVDRWLAAAGVSIRPGEKAHAFRHTYALGQLDNGTTIAELQALLGHADISTTSVYLRLSGAGLHETARAAPITRLLIPRTQAGLETVGTLGDEVAT